MQWRATLWISSTFQMLPTTGIKAILDLIPIYFYLKKLYSRFLLRGLSLPPNHIIKSILSSNGSTKHVSYSLSLSNLTSKQRLHLNSSIINIDNRHNELLSFFPFFDEFDLGNQLINSLSDWFSFYSHSSNIKNYLRNLNDITFIVSSNPSSSIVISDASIKNYVATSISHIHSHDKPIIKIVYQVVNITTTKVKLFAIWCGINQVVGISNVKYIIIITDSLYAIKRIFLLHPYQIHSTAVSWELKEFFLKNSNSCIKFWDCSSKQNWLLHSLVDKNSKSFDLLSIFPCKLS